MKYVCALVILLVCMVGTVSVVAQDTPASMLEAGALSQSYNPVLLDYLLEEGKSQLPEEQHKQAVDQLLTALKANVQVTQGEQLAASLTALGGLLIGGEVGSALSSAESEIWDSWIDSGFVLLRAGYREEAIAFFDQCATQFPGEGERGRCIVGLAQAQPDRALEIVMGLLEEGSVEQKNMALRMMGRMAGSENCPEEQKTVILEALTEKSKGMMNSSYYPGAALGLTYANDPRAVEPLMDLKGGMKQDEVKQLAKQGLLLTYKAEGIADEVAKSLKGGFMAKPPSEQFWAARLLIRAGDERGYEWAQDELSKKEGGGLFSSKNEVNYFDEMLWFLVSVGGEKAKEVMTQALKKGKGKELRKSLLAIGLARLGDPSELDMVREALANDKWNHTRWQAAVALSVHDDYSGIPVLKTLSAKTPKGVEEDVFRRRIAWALGQINHADGVPILVDLLKDANEGVRLSAVNALLRMTVPEAVQGMEAALRTDFGEDRQGSRNPIVQARLVRRALGQFQDQGAPVISGGSQSGFSSVKFLALVAGQGTN
ncbi:MAG: HEAT repeat domain-containing protein [Acidobacteriota bacterium]|nr:MAG: HEAT repeat domain-containing protein [Acidobacteriota bacterium]